MWSNKAGPPPAAMSTTPGVYVAKDTAKAYEFASCDARQHQQPNMDGTVWKTRGNRFRQIYPGARAIYISIYRWYCTPS